jgi:hypothetical protein
MRAARRRISRATITMAVTLALLASAPAASASQSAAWGWTTDTQVMSFFGGIPYRGCEKASLTVPNDGKTGNISSTTQTSIVIGFANCSNSTIPSALNSNTIRTRSSVLRNGNLVLNCQSALVYNSSGQGSVSASTGSSCDKTTTASSTWTVQGYYGWWDYDDVVWRGEWIANPEIDD